MKDYCKCRFPRPEWAPDQNNRFGCTHYCKRCLRGLKPKKPHTQGLVQTHTEAEREYPTHGVISFERVSRGIAPPDPNVTMCDICGSSDYLVFKCPDALYRCATCHNRSFRHLASNRSPDPLIDEEAENV